MAGDEPRSAPPRCGAQRNQVPRAEAERWINQIREEFRNSTAASCAFQNENKEAMTEVAMSFISIRQELEGDPTGWIGNSSDTKSDTLE